MLGVNTFGQGKSDRYQVTTLPWMPKKQTTNPLIGFGASGPTSMYPFYKDNQSGKIPTRVPVPVSKSVGTTGAGFPPFNILSNK